MESSVSVRFVKRQDFGEWLPLWEGYNAFYGRSGPTALNTETTKMTWTCFFDAYEPVRALIAESNGELLGLAHFLFHRSTISIEPFCYLQDLFTKESARTRRGQGIDQRRL